MYSDAPCSGCRSTKHNGCSIEGCFLLKCTKSHSIDFFRECEEFPCQKVHKLFEEVVYRQWLDGNQQIRDYCIECFWEKILIIHIINHEKGNVKFQFIVLLEC